MSDRDMKNAYHNHRETTRDRVEREAEGSRAELQQLLDKERSKNSRLENELTDMKTSVTELEQMEEELSNYLADDRARLSHSMTAAPAHQSSAATLIQNKARQKKAIARVEERRRSSNAATLIQNKARQKKAVARVEAVRSGSIKPFAEQQQQHHHSTSAQLRLSPPGASQRQIELVEAQNKFIGSVCEAQDQLTVVIKAIAASKLRHLVAEQSSLMNVAQAQPLQEQEPHPSYEEPVQEGGYYNEDGEQLYEYDEQAYYEEQAY